MKHPITILFLIGCSLNFVACSDQSHSPAETQNVLAVQKALLPIDRGITIGGAFKQYPYTRNLKWTEAAPVMGRTFVEVSGDVDADRLFSDLSKQAHLDEVEFAKTHNLQEIEKQWRPKLSHMKMICRFQLNVDGSVEPIQAAFEEQGHGPWYLWGNDLNAVLRMVYYDSMPLFILDGFVHPSDGRP